MIMVVFEGVIVAYSVINLILMIKKIQKVSQYIPCYSCF